MSEMPVAVPARHLIVIITSDMRFSLVGVLGLKLLSFLTFLLYHPFAQVTRVHDYDPVFFYTPRLTVVPVNENIISSLEMRTQDLDDHSRPQSVKRFVSYQVTDFHRPPSLFAA